MSNYEFVLYRGLFRIFLGPRMVLRTGYYFCHGESSEVIKLASSVISKIRFFMKIVNLELLNIDKLINIFRRSEFVFCTNFLLLSIHVRESFSLGYKIMVCHVICVSFYWLIKKVISNINLIFFTKTKKVPHTYISYVFIRFSIDEKIFKK